jgi:hypothetical protein
MRKYLVFILCFFVVNAIQAQRKSLPRLKSNKEKLTLLIDGVSYGEAVELKPKLKPDVWNFPVKNKVMHVVFKSAIDSIAIDLKGGKKFDFVVITAKDTAYLQAVGQKFTNPANFTRSYIKANNLKTIVDIPPVYELTNIIIALTPSASENRNLAFRNSAYYKAVIEKFGQYKNERIVAIVDSLIKQDKYANLKMDAYSFEMKEGKIVDSKIYDRVSWGAKNTLRPFKKELQYFAGKTDFLSFYNAHKTLYDSQISCYRDSIKLPQMVS